MQQQWNTLEAWLKINNPAVLADLNPPATQADIQDLEKTLGTALPQSFIDCLKVHNGQKGKAEWLFDGHQFLSVADIKMNWLIWNDLLEEGDFDGQISTPDRQIQSDWWRKDWIPFSYNGSGDHMCLDLAPTEDGNKGQVINFFHDYSGRKLLSANFNDWFNNFIKSKTL